MWFGEVWFGEVSIGEVSIGEVSIGEVSFGEVWCTGQGGGTRTNCESLFTESKMLC